MAQDELNRLERLEARQDVFERRVESLEQTRWLLLCVIGFLLILVGGMGGALLASPNDAFRAMLSDVPKRNPKDRQHLKYLWIPPWHDPESERVANYLLNAVISHSPAIYRGEMISPEVMVFDPRLLKADLKALDQLIQRDTFFYAETGKFNEGISLDALKLYGDIAKFPIFSLDAFVRFGVASINGGRYYDLRGVPRTLRELMKALAVDVSGSQGNILATYTLTSKVTGNERITTRYQGAVGVYITWDEAEDGYSELLRDPRNFVKSADALEVIYGLPNGLQGYALYDGDGNRQDNAPDNVVSDHGAPVPGSLPRGGGSGTSRLNTFSCVQCHGSRNGYIPIADDNDLILRKSQLFRSGMELALDRDREVFVDTCARISGLDFAAISTRITKMYFDASLDLVTRERAEMELGVSLDYLARTAANVKDPYLRALARGRAIKRAEWDRLRPILAYQIKGYEP